MAREILFKAKRIDNGEWVEGYYAVAIDKIGLEQHYILVTDHTLGYFKWFVIDENTLCRYTGLTDKNGNKIWENDIVRGEGIKPCRVDRGLIKFGTQDIFVPGFKTVQVDGFFIEWKHPTDIGFREDLRYWAKNNCISVIGNVFDNPELLEALAKLKAYEYSKIKVGDIIEVNGEKAVVTSFGTDNNAIHVMYFDGIVNSYRNDINCIKKTGKHIDIQQILEQIGE